MNFDNSNSGEFMHEYEYKMPDSVEELNLNGEEIFIKKLP